MEESEILDNLRVMLAGEKFTHSLGVSKEAVRLAKIYGADVEKCRLAGLLHDCAKKMTPDMLGMTINDFGDGNPYCGINRRVVHGPMGAIVARRKFGVTDETVLEAISNHVTGRPEMSMESCIVFIADYTEENREGEVFDEIRSVLDEKGIFAAIVKACDSTTELIIKRGEQMDAQMVYTRNWAVTKLK